EGASPLPVPHPHPFAHARRGNAIAHLVDLAGAVVVGDHARKGDLAREPGAALHVGRIDSGGGELDPHLAAARLRRLDIRHLRHGGGWSVRLVIGSPHHDPRFLTGAFRPSPGLISSMSALVSISTKAAASAPVRKAWAPSCSSSA